MQYTVAHNHIVTYLLSLFYGGCHPSLRCISATFSYRVLVLTVNLAVVPHFSAHSPLLLPSKKNCKHLRGGERCQWACSEATPVSCQWLKAALGAFVPIGRGNLTWGCGKVSWKSCNELFTEAKNLVSRLQPKPFISIFCKFTKVSMDIKRCNNVCTKIWIIIIGLLQYILN